MISLKKISLFFFITLIVAGCMNASPEQQAGEVVRSNLRSPSSFKYVDGEVLWSGNTLNGEKAYVVAVSYDAQNGFGAILRGCAMVAYFVADNGQLRWSNISGYQEMPNSLQAMCNKNVPLERKTKYASDIASINKFTKSEIKNKNSNSNTNEKNELIGLSYSKVKKLVLEDGWSPIKRTKQFSSDPALQYCYEDTCTSYFGKKDKVQVVVYSICNVNRYVDCPGKSEGFEQVDKVYFEDKNSAEIEYRKIMSHYFED